MATNLIMEKLTKATLDNKCLSDIRRVVSGVKEDMEKVDAFNRIESILLLHDIMTGDDADGRNENL